MGEPTTNGNSGTSAGFTDFDAIGIDADAGDETGNNAAGISSRITDRIPKRRGRPPKQRNNDAPTGTQPETITVEESETPPVKRATTRRTSKAQAKEDAQQNAFVLVSMMDTVAANVAGPEATLNSFERALIQPSLERTLARSGAATEKINQAMDPLALVIGLSMWGSRILGVRQQKQALARAGYASPPPIDPTINTTPQPTPQPSPPNGAMSPDELLRSIER